MLCSVSQLINMLCAKCLLHWQCHCSLALAGNTAVCKMLCCAAWSSSSLDLWAGRTHKEHRQVPNVRSLERKAKMTLTTITNAYLCHLLEITLLSCVLQMEIVTIVKRDCASKEGGFGYSLAVPCTCKKCSLLPNSIYVACRVVRLCLWLSLFCMAPWYSVCYKTAVGATCWLSFSPLVFSLHWER